MRILHDCRGINRRAGVLYGSKTTASGVNSNTILNSNTTTRTGVLYDDNQRVDYEGSIVDKAILDALALVEWVSCDECGKPLRSSTVAHSNTMLFQNKTHKIRLTEEGT